jgi:hypothetical protein
MRRLVCSLLLCAVAALSGRADDALVEASKAAKAKRKKSTAKVITDADVKKSKGVLIDSTTLQKPLEPAALTPEETFRADRKAREQALVQIAALDTQRAELEAEAALIEQSYYDENNLSRRDTEVVQRFSDVKARLESVKAQREVLVRNLPPDPVVLELAKPAEGKTPKS